MDLAAAFISTGQEDLRLLEYSSHFCELPNLITFDDSTLKYIYWIGANDGQMLVPSGLDDSLVPDISQALPPPLNPPSLSSPSPPLIPPTSSLLCHFWSHPSSSLPHRRWSPQHQVSILDTGPAQPHVSFVDHWSRPTSNSLLL